MKNDHLVVVDMQTNFLRDKDPKDLDSKMGTQLQMIQDFRNRGLPVRFLLLKNSTDFGDIDSRLQPEPEEIVIKEQTDGYPELREIIEPDSHLHFIGCNTDFCVNETAKSALANGHRITLYPNALLSQDSSLYKQQKTLLRYRLDPRSRVRNYRK